MKTFSVSMIADGGFKGVIFDLDGTLLDSMQIWEDVGEKYLLSQSVKPEEDLRETLRTMSLRQAAEYCQKNYKVKKTVEEIIEGVTGIVEDFYKKEAELKPGVKEFLEELSAQDVKMCVATASEMELVEAALTRCGIRDYFVDILTCSQVGCGKDQPLIYEEALKILGTERSKTLVFEDSLHAITTAKQAGFTVVGVYEPSEQDQERVRGSVDYYIEDFYKDK